MSNRRYKILLLWNGFGNRLLNGFINRMPEVDVCVAGTVHVTVS
jgi:hypothetical protein